MKKMRIMTVLRKQYICNSTSEGTSNQVCPADTEERGNR